MDILKLFKYTIDNKASDLHISVGVPPIMRCDGILIKIGDTTLSPADTEEMVRQLLDENQISELHSVGELDLSFSKPGIGRFRVNVFMQRNSYCIALRALALNVPTIDELSLPPVIKTLAEKKQGMILVAGPAGSGKSTTIATIVDHINTNFACHILTLEDPIEYLHKHKKSIVNQREIGNDTTSLEMALTAAFRQDPDVILIGELRDMNSISTALMAAESGQLVLSTLPTNGSVNTINRLVDIFPSHQQQQVRYQLSSVLEGVVSQYLLPKPDAKGRVAALEVLIATPAVRGLIREGKTSQIQSLINSGSKAGMITIDESLASLYLDNQITIETAYARCVNKETIRSIVGL